MTREILVENLLIQINDASNVSKIQITSEIRKLDDGYVVKEVLSTDFVPEKTRH